MSIFKRELNNKIIITAHSGACNTVDNTLESLKILCEQKEVDVVEIDVCQTEDNVFFMNHDDFVFCDFNKLNVIDIEYSKLPENYRKERLEDAFKFLASKSISINLDLKNVVNFKNLLDLVNKYNLLDRVILTGCEYEKCLIIDREARDFNKLVNVGRVDISEEEFINLILEKYHEINVLGLNINYRYCTDYFKTRMDEHNIPVYVWTVDLGADFEKMKSINVAGITTKL